MGPLGDLFFLAPPPPSFSVSEFVFESAFVSVFEFPFPDSVSLSSILFVSEFVFAPVFELVAVSEFVFVFTVTSDLEFEF